MVVVVDQDRRDCLELKAEMLEILRSCQPRPETLFRIAVGKEIHYALTDDRKEEILAALPANRKYDVSRFKGLGEMPSKYLKETTLDPATRILLRVDIEAQLEADKTFQQLLGKDASQRYEVIMSEANLVEDLDI